VLADGDAVVLRRQWGRTRLTDGRPWTRRARRRHCTDEFRVEWLQIRSFLAIFLSELRFVRFWEETPKNILKGETPNGLRGLTPRNQCGGGDLESDLCKARLSLAPSARWNDCAF
jgi:hypothetical protein